MAIRALSKLFVLVTVLVSGAVAAAETEAPVQDMAATAAAKTAARLAERIDQVTFFVARSPGTLAEAGDLCLEPEVTKG